MNPPLRFFVWDNIPERLLCPDQIVSVYTKAKANGYITFIYEENNGWKEARSKDYGQSAGVNDANDNELFAGAVVVQTSEPYQSAVVKFIEGEFVFVYKIGNQIMKCSVSSLNKIMVLVGHQWMDQAELKQRIAQAKAKLGL